MSPLVVEARNSKKVEELGGQLVVAAVALRAGATPEELRERVRDQLSSYKVPRHVLRFP